MRHRAKGKFVPGPDIFLSYNREDSGRAKLFAEAFAAEGFEVWWDVALRSGEAYDEVTEAALANARAVVVLWSPRSVVSRWVRAEATEAERNKTLLPAMIEPCKRPIMFELVQTAELSHWQGDEGDAAWRTFLEDVRRFVGQRPAPSAAPMAAAPMTAGTSVVVLPFANMSNDPEQEYFADGITEDIITDLSKVSALMVIARNTAFTFKGKHVDVKDIARQLGVTHVLEGSVRKAGNRVRVTAQLIDGATGGHVWADRYDRDLDDIFEIQDELSEAIVGALKVKLLPQEKSAIEDRETRNAEAYDYYLRARAMRAMMKLDEIPRSLDAYRKAIELDPDFALAWAGLASSLMQNRAHFPDAGIGDDEIDRALARAMELAPDSPDVVACRGHRAIYERDWAVAEECLERFRKAGDDNWSIFSHLLLILGRKCEAAIQQEKVRKADPLSVGASWALQFHLDCADRFDDAEAEYRNSRSALPGAARPMQWEAIKRKFAMGEEDAARAEFVTDFAINAALFPYAADLAAALGDPAKAQTVLRSALGDPILQDQLNLMTVADCAMLAGDRDLVFEAMRRAYVETPGPMIIGLWHPIFAPLRPDPRFKQILADLGLPDYWRKTGNWGDFARPKGDDDFELIA
jgi:adenylate cyclase